MYTPEHLTNLLTTDREKLTRICAEVCYGWSLEDLHPTSYFHGWYDNKAFVMDARAFNPLEDSVKGRSQAFELAVKFGLVVLYAEGKANYQNMVTGSKFRYLKTYTLR